MRKLIYSIATLGILALYTPAQAQSYSLEVGTAMYASSTPHSAGFLTFLIGDGNLRSYTSFEARPISSTNISYTTRTGIERTLFADDNVALNAIAQAGIATNSNAAAGAFSGGGNVAIQLKNGFALTFTMEALASPLVGWEPQARAGLRYRFGE